jgi:hypothetical protein
VAGDPTTVDLFLGDDDQYVKLEQNHGNIVVGTNTTVTNSTWTFGTDGVLTLPNGMIINASDSISTVTIGGPNTEIRIDDGGAPPGLYITTDKTGAGHGWLFGPDGELQFPQGSTISETTSTTIIQAGNNKDLLLNTFDYVNSTIRTWTFGTDGVLTLSTASVILGNSSDPNVYIETSTTATTSTWTFGTDGSTTLPIGVSIDEYYGSHFPRIVADSGKAFSLQGQGSTGSVALQWIETESTSSRIAQVGLNKLSGVASVTLTAGTSTNDMKVWRFDETGSTTFPDSTVQTTAYPGVLVPADGDGVSGNANMVFYAGTDWYNTSKVTINPTSSMLTLNGNSGTGGITFPDATVQTTAYTGATSTSTLVNGTSTISLSSTGTVTFPDGTVQTTAYVPATASASTYTGWFKAAGTVVQLDTLLARINSTGTMQISSTIVETIGQGSAFAWNGVRNKGATMSSFGQGGTNWVMPGDWLDISATPLDNEFEVATVSVFKLGGTGSLYRITYVGATNNKWSVNIERVAQG